MHFTVSTILSGRFSRLAGLAVLGLTALAFSTSPATAQDEGASAATARPGLQLDVITVRARKFDENLQDTPVTLTAIDQNVIDDARLEDFQDFLFLVPGATFDQTRFNSNQTIVLRGVQGAPEELAEPGFGLYRDGAYYGGSRTNFGQFIDVESVEVLRGPQGGIFGRNAVGGAMNIRFNKPDPDGGFYGSAEIGYARYDEVDLEFIANVPIVEGKFAARAVAWYTNRKGGEYFNVTLGEELDKMEDKGGRIAFYFEPTDNFDVTFTAEAQSTEGPEGLHFFPEPSYFNPEGETKKTIRRDTLSETESDFRYFSAEANWETDIGTFTLIGSY
ncbi:MAG: TonB-dependent receptor plug domain-containing protein, partial [Alphaproteobacteria bacterium]|nr:TonB-dependent receptor plug domain-containing protein [Alphaproteobacteria bacterium]